MNTLDAIENRRSIRKFKSKDIPKELIEKLLDAAIKAPSAKNRQPWKFYVVTQKHKEEMLLVMRQGIENEKNRAGLLPNSLQYIPSASYSAEIMEQAPVTVFIFNSLGNFFEEDTSSESKFYDTANIQSIGAAIENMLLTAVDLGLGSLWICDVFFAYRELCQWLNEKSQLVAAISLGYPDENPDPRPRKDQKKIVEWM